MPKKNINESLNKSAKIIIPQDWDVKTRKDLIDGLEALSDWDIIEITKEMKSKPKILSNELDQVPKRRDFGYGKVVNSMREEMTEAMNSVNVPNILSNNSDQAPKTRAAGYEENVLKPLQKEINERMDTIFMHWSGLICDYVNDFANEPNNRFILERISALKPWDSMTFEIKREKIKYSWRRKTVWDPIFPENINKYFHNFYSRTKTLPEPWEVSSSIIIKKDENDPKLLEVHAEQFEYPGKWAFLSNGIFFHNPNVSDEDFQEIISNISDSEEDLNVDSKEETSTDSEKETWNKKVRWWLWKKK